MRSIRSLSGRRLVPFGDDESGGFGDETTLHQVLNFIEEKRSE